MVSIWSPTYFQSRWCMTEWRSFRARETQLNLGFRGLVAAVRFHDGEHFPPEAHEIHWIDFAPYTSTFDSCWDDLYAVEFEDRIKVLAKTLAIIVARAPEFDPAWPIVDTAPRPAPRVGMRRLQEAVGMKKPANRDWTRRSGSAEWLPGVFLTEGPARARASRW